MINVLVAVDLCDHSALTIEVAHALALGARGRITALHVVRLPEKPPSTSEEEWNRLKSYALASGDKSLEELLVRIGLAHKVEKRLRLGGEASVVIGEEANRMHADLVVVGVHERPFLTSLLAGGTGRRVQRRAHCPVVTVRSGKPEEIAERLSYRRPRRPIMREEVLE